MYHLTDNIHVIERADWHARSGRPQMAGQTNPHEVFIHHSDTAHAGGLDHLEEQKQAARIIQNFHMDVRGWSDIAYHYLIFQPYGNAEYARVFEGRMVKHVPAAQLGHNTGTIAVCVVGNFDHADKVKDNTVWAIAKLLTEQRNKTGIHDPHTIGGHRDVVQTTCPGDTLYGQIPRIARDAGLRVYR